MILTTALAALALLAAPGSTLHRGPTPQPQNPALPSLDALAAYPYRAPVSDQLRDPRLVRTSAPLEMEQRFGVPSFVFAAPSSDAISPRQAGATADGAARQHLGRYASLYGISPAQVAKAQVLGVHDTGQGAVIVRFGQQLSGTPIFREELAVTMNRELELVSLSGFFTALPQVRPGARLQPVDAVGAALAAIEQPELSASQLVPAPSRIPGELRFDAAPGAQVSFVRPARVKRVYYHLPDALEPAYYVELFVANPEQSGDAAYALVVSARDGHPLFRHSLIAYDFSYRAWASDDLADGGIGAPFDGPYGNGLDPHPTGNIFTSLNPPFTTPGLHTLNHGPTLLDDPWLYPDAGETVGNNADAYADLKSPDGYSPQTGDFRADLTAPFTFDRTYDTSKSAESSKEQQKASIAQLFYDVNFFHDWYYTAGFDEASGNAQAHNYGRGGVEGDVLLAEAQDYSGRNNSNMETPSDGESPRMQMYVWDSAAPTTLQVSAPASAAGSYTVAGATFGPQTYHLAGEVVAISGSNHEGCSAFASSDADLVHGKIALVDRGTCSFQLKALNAQTAGAVGIIVAQNRTDAPFEMGDDSSVAAVTIPSEMIGQSDGQTLRAASGVAVVMDRSTAVDRDGTIDNQIVGHEWGHYISNRLIHDGNGLDTNMAGGMGEGWADFHAMLLTVRPEDATLAQNVEWSGIWPLTAYVSAGADPQFGFYFGIRRVPYSTDLTKDPLTYGDIAEGQPLPDTAPEAFGQDGVGNSEVHNTGEVWCTMLWEAYAALLRQTPQRLSFDEARDRMRAYLVAAYKITPQSPTFLEARDALLAVAYANDLSDFNAFQKAFAKRGAGLRAVSPDRYSSDNTGVVEDYSWGNDVAVVSATLTDDGQSCDHDGVLDDGETGTLTVVLKNIGGAPLSHTSAHVTSADGALDIGGATIQVPESDPFGPTVTAKLPVSLKGASGITPLNLAVSVSDPDLSSFGVSQTVVAIPGNYDVVPAASATDSVESPNVVWTATAENGTVNLSGFGEVPLDTSVNWQRIAASSTDHRLFGVDDAQPSLIHLVSPKVDVGAAGLVVTLKARWSFEVDPQDPSTFYDGAILELSTDDGATWKDIGDQANPGYGGALYDQSGNPLAGQSAFVGTNPSWPGFDRVAIPLGKDYAGKSVRLRFSVGSDAAEAAYGMELDDITFSGITNTPFDAVVADRHICEANPPVAKASFPSAVVSGRTYSVDGSGSVSPHGGALSFAWTQLAGPELGLSDPTSSKVTFTAPDVALPTLAKLQLVVSDGTSNGAPLVASFTVLPRPTATATQATFSALAPSSGCGTSGGGFELLALAGLALLVRRRR